MKSNLTGNIDQDCNGGGGFSTENKKMEMGLDFRSKLKPFANGCIAALFTDIPLLVLPVSAMYDFASNTKDPVKKQLRYKEFNTAFESFHNFFPIHIITHSLMLGSFEILTRKAVVTNDGMPISFYKEVGCAVLAATIGQGVNAPFVSAHHLMPEDMKLPIEKRANYASIYDAIYRISAKEGISALWTRKASLVYSLLGFHAVQLASYHPSLNYFKGSFALDETAACLSAGAISRFCGSILYAPFVTAQAHMKMIPNAQGQYPYTSSLECILKILKSEGLFTLYRKFPRCAALNIPHTMILWLMFEEFSKLRESHGT